ncbi:formate dehydrogenase subunit gamma [Marinobacterium jannaschii]|uniref:formate dehydrogenase subunit gamma n=1 Tax=Marinobacterium jannaschii TaxID=64970 RepID=UPI00047F53C3|nr:formate dehydrogenase subunit gamma [Marinobacterium jannaschii]
MQIKLLLKLAALLISLIILPVKAEDSVPSEQRVAAFAGAEYWQVIRQGENGTTQSSTAEAGNLINVQGDYWRYWRNQWITPAGAFAVGGTLGLLAIFYLIVGQKKLDAPRSGNTIQRWSRLDRANHWTVAILFIILGISGLSLLYGKFVLKSVMGDGLWASYMLACKLAHNYLGPLFVLGLLLMILRWMKHNVFNRTDLTWFIKGGGIIGNAHPSAGYMNGGEKIWFWLLTLFGIAVCVSGLILDFPNFDQVRNTMQWANLVHAAGSLILIAASLGHIYIGTLGTEGALEGMTTGQVDETWAKQHHDLWYQEVKAREAKDTV